MIGNNGCRFRLKCGRKGNEGLLRGKTAGKVVVSVRLLLL